MLQRLEARGVPVTPQYGAAGYRIDFACAHPRQPGRMVLAIEADGAAYHSSPTARDRTAFGSRSLKAWVGASIESGRPPGSRTGMRRWTEQSRRGRRRYAVPTTETTPIRQTGPIHLILPRHPRHWIPVRSSPRDPRPNVPPGYPITDYSPVKLASLARWILSDTLLRTDEDLMAEMRQSSVSSAADPASTRPSKMPSRRCVSRNVSMSRSSILYAPS